MLFITKIRHPRLEQNDVAGYIQSPCCLDLDKISGAMKWSAHDTDRRRRICWYVVGRLRDVACAFGLSWSNVWKKEEGAPNDEATAVHDVRPAGCSLIVQSTYSKQTCRPDDPAGCSLSCYRNSVECGGGGARFVKICKRIGWGRDSICSLQKKKKKWTCEYFVAWFGFVMLTESRRSSQIVPLLVATQASGLRSENRSQETGKQNPR